MRRGWRGRERRGGSRATQRRAASMAAWVSPAKVWALLLAFRLSAPATPLSTVKPRKLHRRMEREILFVTTGTVFHRVAVIEHNRIDFTCARSQPVSFDPSTR